VRQVVARLSHRRRTRPFDLLKDSFNYFQAWVPSPDAGISVLGDLYRDEGADYVIPRIGQAPGAKLRPMHLVDLFDALARQPRKGHPPGKDTDDAPGGTPARTPLAALTQLHVYRALFGALNHRQPPTPMLGARQRCCAGGGGGRESNPPGEGRSPQRF
jgi:hypothetical protein